MAFVNFTKFLEKLFVVLGFNLLNLEGDPCFCHILPFVVFINLFLLCLSWLSYSIANISNIESATNTLCTLFAGISSEVKMILFYVHRKKFVEAMWKLKSISSKDHTEKRMLEVENKKVILITKLFACLVGLAVVAIITTPLGRMTFIFWKYKKVSYFLPFNGLYPFDLENPLFFSLTFLWITLVTMSVTLFSALLITLFIAILFNLFAQLRLLNRKIDLLKVDVAQDLQKEVGEIVSHHQLILDLIKEVNALFRPILFVQFLMGAMQLCTTSFQVVVLYKDPQILFYGCYLCICLSELLMYCYCGNIIQSESGGFATHIYLGYWYTFPPKIAHSLYLAMMRSQRPSKFDGYFFEANLITFNSIVTTTYSYIIFLQSLLE